MRSIVRNSFILVLVFFLGMSAHADIIKSPNDHREYRAFALENRMNVLVISDTQSDVAAASLSVQIGGGDDYEHRPGIAHFLEHMLFIGTERYPVVDEYRAVVNKNGGDSNAYTSIERTNYNFTVDPQAFEQVLDRFARFFIDPLLSKEFVEREREAVHAEFVIRKQSDSGMRWSAMKTLFNPEHPASKFIAGNRESLSGDVTQDLRNFFNEYYSANLMSLVLIGPQSLDEFQQWATKYFSDVKDSDAVKPQTDEPMFEPETLPAILKVKTEENDPTLRIIFPIFDLKPYWREQPDDYISNLIGHEGRGSLLSHLKDRGLALGLYASRGLSSYGSATYNIVIHLTDSGLSDWEAVVDSVFEYIHLARRNEIQRWRFDEQKALAEFDFRFLEPSHPRQYATFLADIMPNYPVDRILRALYVQEEYAPELIERLLAKLTADNALYIITSPDVETDSVSPIIEAQYSLSDVSDSVAAKWRSSDADIAMQLPEPNRFIPEQFDLIDATEPSLPKLVRSSDGFRLWHQTDTSFDVPRANFYFSIRSPAGRRDATHSVLLSLFTDLLNDQLNEFAYPALLAGLGYELYPHSRGISVKLSGYSDNQEALLQRVLDVLGNPEFDQAKFERHRIEAIREIENFAMDSASSLAISEVHEILLSPYWTDEESLQALRSITLDDLKLFADEFFDRIQIVAVSHGNISEQDSIGRGALVENALADSLRSIDVSKSQVVMLPRAGPFVKRLPVEHEDTAVAVYFQGAGSSMPDRANYALLSQIIRSPFFSELRTRQQLGYVVYASNMRILDVPGLIFVIQSPDAEPEHLHAAVAEFLFTFHESVERMPEQEFKQHQAGFVSRILERDQTLRERTERYWRAIDNRDFEFDEHERFAQAVNDLEHASFVEFVRDIFHTNLVSRFAVEAYGEHFEVPQTESVFGGEIVRSNEEFKSGLPLFPKS